jgi:hypothetical protein
LRERECYGGGGDEVKETKGTRETVRADVWDACESSEIANGQLERRREESRAKRDERREGRREVEFRAQAGLSLYKNGESRQKKVLQDFSRRKYKGDEEITGKPPSFSSFLPSSTLQPPFDQRSDVPTLSP